MAYNILLEYLQLRKWTIESEEGYREIRGKTGAGPFVVVLHDHPLINKVDAMRFCEFSEPHLVVVAEKASAPATQKILEDHFTKVEIIHPRFVQVNILNNCDQPVFTKIDRFPRGISDDEACLMSKNDPVAIVLGYDVGTRVRADFKCPGSGLQTVYYYVSNCFSNPERSSKKRDAREIDDE